MSKDIQQIQQIKDLAIYILELKFSLEKLKESLSDDVKLAKYVDTILANQMLGPTTKTLMESSANLVVHITDFKKELEDLVKQIGLLSNP